MTIVFSILVYVLTKEGSKNPPEFLKKSTNKVILTFCSFKRGFSRLIYSFSRNSKLNYINFELKYTFFREKAGDICRIGNMG